MSLEGLTGVQKAEVLLITLGPERSAEIFKHLKDEEIEELKSEGYVSTYDSYVINCGISYVEDLNYQNSITLTLIKVDNI